MALPEGGTSRPPYCEREDALRRYAGLLAACSTVRLTGTRDPSELYEVHIRDCLASVPFLPERGPVIDVGSGGGLPGIVWAICRPDLGVVLLDSVGKKCRAVREIADALGLANVEVVCGRSEDVAGERRERFSLACARAVGSAGVTAELLSPLVRVGGLLLTFKGARLEQELAEVQGADGKGRIAWRRLGLRAPIIHPRDDGANSSLSIVTGEKTSPCPRTFPRRPGMAASKGWWA